MSDALEVYEELTRRFVIGELSTQEFQSLYMSRFLNEAAELSEQQFLLLDAFFGDVECFTDDPELLLEDPGFYLDEKHLHLKAAEMLLQMQKMGA
jgi:hypothetical protein